MIKINVVLNATPPVSFDYNCCGYLVCLTAIGDHRLDDAVIAAELWRALTIRQK